GRSLAVTESEADDPTESLDADNPGEDILGSEPAPGAGVGMDAEGEIAAEQNVDSDLAQVSADGEAGQEPGSSSITTPDITSPTQENQAKGPQSDSQPPAEAAEKLQFPESLEPRIQEVNELLESKERQVLSYI